MENKSILTKFIELAMNCQTQQAKKVFHFIKQMPDGPEKEKLTNHLRKSYNQIMNDCNNVLEAEKKYNQMISN